MRSTTRSTRSGDPLEETQERTRQNEAKIGEVDKTAQAAGASAQAAGAAAKDARGAANQASGAAKAAANTASTAVAKAEAVDKATRKLVFEVVLSEDQGNFKFAKTELPDEAKAKLDEMITRVKADPKGACFEIEGHTDNVGDSRTQRAARPRARRSRQALSVRAAPDSAAQDERHQLRRRKAGRAEQDPGRPRAEPPRRDQGPRVIASRGRRSPSSQVFHDRW